MSLIYLSDDMSKDTKRNTIIISHSSLVSSSLSGRNESSWYDTKLSDGRTITSFDEPYTREVIPANGTELWHILDPEQYTDAADNIITSVCVDRYPVTSLIVEVGIHSLTMLGMHPLGIFDLDTAWDLSKDQTHANNNNYLLVNTQARTIWSCANSCATQSFEAACRWALGKEVTISPDFMQELAGHDAVTGEAKKANIG